MFAIVTNIGKPQAVIINAIFSLLIDDKICANLPQKEDKQQAPR